ncbi:MAG: hypothetical protein A2V66_16260 [Ignavibacteria bacterium RBG_13_36_8]|nr:MAG: hypothetical protein A2V66_16260 [Ignavibacteria bacterium RBG_13_36_8]
MEKQHQGLWRIKNYEPISGILKVDNKKQEIILDLYRYNTPFPDEGFPNEGMELDLITGQLITDEYVTLLDCKGGFKKQTNRNKIYQFRIKTAIIGKEVLSPASVTFPNYFLHFTWFEYWFGEHSFTIDKVSENKRITYNRKEPLEVKVPSLSLEFQIVSSPNFSDNLPKSCSISQFCWFNINFETEIHLKDIFPSISMLQIFLEFCAQENIYPNQLQGCRMISGQKATFKIIYAPFLGEFDEELDENILLEFLFPPKENLLTPNNVATNLKQLFNPIMLFQEIKVDFEKIIEKWFQLYKKSQTEIDLYIASRRNFNDIPRSTFLNLVVALEGFHRQQNVKEKVLPKERYRNDLLPLIEKECNNLVDTVCTTETEADRNAMKEAITSQLKMANQHVLKDRFRDMINSVSDYGLSEINANVEDFIKKVVQTRNEMSHGLGENQIPSNEELLDTNRKLKLLFEALILRELGILKKRNFGIWEPRQNIPSS